MDIVERIRQRIELFSPGGDNERLLQEAADLIERQEAEIDRLREQLRLTNIEWANALAQAGDAADEIVRLREVLGE